MTPAKKLSGIALAATAASLFALAPITGAVAADAEVECHGVNDCSGQGACKTASNDCTGQNSCKGQGFLKLSKEECEAKGGEVKS